MLDVRRLILDLRPLMFDLRRLMLVLRLLTFDLSRLTFDLRRPLSKEEPRTEWAGPLRLPGCGYRTGTSFWSRIGLPPIE